MDRFADTLGSRRGLDVAQARQRERQERDRAELELTVSLVACAREVAALDIGGDSNILNWVTGSHNPPVDSELTAGQRAAVLDAWRERCAELPF